MYKRQRERNPEQAARKFVGDKVKDVEAALQGAKDIIAETVRDVYKRQVLVSFCLLMSTIR